MPRTPIFIVVLLAATLVWPASAEWSTAVAAFDAGDYTAARQGFEDYLAVHPGFAGAHFMLARTLAKLGDDEAGREAFRHAADLEPDNPSYAYAAARVELEDGDAAAALARLTAVGAAPVDPATGSAIALLAATAHLRMDAPADAVATLEKAAGAAPTDARLQAALGVARSRDGDLARAHDAWARAFELDPSDAASALDAAEAALDLAGSTEDEAAARWLAEAISRSEQLASASTGDGHALLAGRARLAAGDLDEAAAWFDAALAAGGVADPRTLYFSGRTLRCLGRYEAARERLVRALAASPDADLEPLIHRQLARTCEAMLELDEAAEHHRRGGDGARAVQVEKLAASFAEALASRRGILERIAQFETMADDLEHIRETDGADRVRRRIVDLEAQLRAIDANLEEVKAALRDRGGCG